MCKFIQNIYGTAIFERYEFREMDQFGSQIFQGFKRVDPD